MKVLGSGSGKLIIHPSIRIARSARVDNSMAKLIVVAPPKFLGLLREKLDNTTHKLVIHTLAKDLSKASLADIQNAVSDLR